MNHDIAYREIRIPDVNNIFHVQLSIPDASPLAGINGPDQSLIRRLRLHRDFTYREIGVLDVKIIYHVQLSIPDASPLAGINDPKSTSI